MLSKEKVLKTIHELPDNFSMDQLIDRVLTLQKKKHLAGSASDVKCLSGALEKKKLKNALVFKRKSF